MLKWEGKKKAEQPQQLGQCSNPNWELRTTRQCQTTPNICFYCKGRFPSKYRPTGDAETEKRTYVSRAMTCIRETLWSEFRTSKFQLQTMPNVCFYWDKPFSKLKIFLREALITKKNLRRATTTEGCNATLQKIKNFEAQQTTLNIRFCWGKPFSELKSGGGGKEKKTYLESYHNGEDNTMQCITLC